MSTTASTSYNKSDLSLPYIEGFVQYPNISPQTLADNIEEFARDESVFIYLDDLISVAEGMLAYAESVRPVLDRIAEAVRAEDEADA